MRNDENNDENNEENNDENEDDDLFDNTVAGEEGVDNSKYEHSYEEKNYSFASKSAGLTNMVQKMLNNRMYSSSIRSFSNSLLLQQNLSVSQMKKRALDELRNSSEKKQQRAAEFRQQQEGERKGSALEWEKRLRRARTVQRQKQEKNQAKLVQK